MSVLDSEFNKTIKSAFQTACLTLIIVGYKGMISSKEFLKMYSVDQDSIRIEEDNFTANLIKYIKNNETYQKLNKENHFTIVPQASIYTDEILSLDKSASEAAIIDFKIIGWYPNESNYFVECKILVVSNWSTPKGHIRIANQLFKRYINTGINNFLSGHYPQNGCLVAYVLHGSCQDTKDRLNEYLINIDRVDEVLNDDYKILDHASCYVSRHANTTIKHLFLKF